MNQENKLEIVSPEIVTEIKIKSNRGGPRVGAGRKPGATKMMREIVIAQLVADGEIEKSLKFMIKMRDDATVENNLRLAAAKEIKDTLAGKPSQAHEISGPDGGPVPVSGVPEELLESMTEQTLLKVIGHDA